MKSNRFEQEYISFKGRIDLMFFYSCFMIYKIINNQLNIYFSYLIYLIYLYLRNQYFLKNIKNPSL